MNENENIFSANHENVSTCPSCGRIVNLDDIMNENEIETPAIPENVSTCPHCGRLVNLDEESMYIVNRGFTNRWWSGEDLEHEVCEDCLEDLYRCDACEEYYTRVHIDYHNGSTCICRNCSDDYRECYDCGGVYHIDDMSWDDGLGEYLCDECYSRRTARNRVHEYRFKPIPTFGLKKGCDVSKSPYAPKDELTFGVELEVDYGDDRDGLAEAITDTTDMVYLKKDGSLCHNGVEIVSHPCNIAYHMEAFGWDDIMQACREYGYKSHGAGTCGLHVHVGREQLGSTPAERKATVAKVILLTDRHEKLLFKLSRRKDCEWAAFNKAPVPPVDKFDADMVDEIINDSDCKGRYLVVNTQNSGTVEIRIFRGTLRRDSFFGALQFVSNLFHYAMTHTAEQCLNSSFYDVARYERYTELEAAMAARFNAYEVTLAESGAARHDPTIAERILYNVGDWVRSTCYDDSNGYVGQVVTCSTPAYGYGRREQSLGVVFPQGLFGHSLDDGITRSGDGNYHGWYVRSNYVERVEETDLPEELRGIDCTSLLRNDD